MPIRYRFVDEIRVLAVGEGAPGKLFMPRAYLAGPALTS